MTGVGITGVEIAYPEGSDDYAAEMAGVEIAYPQGSDDYAAEMAGVEIASRREAMIMLQRWQV